MRVKWEVRMLALLVSVLDFGSGLGQGESGLCTQLSGFGCFATRTEGEEGRFIEIGRHWPSNPLWEGAGRGCNFARTNASGIDESRRRVRMHTVVRQSV